MDSWDPFARLGEKICNVAGKSFDNYFCVTKFLSQKALSGNVVELGKGYSTMKTFSKSVHIWLHYGQKTDEKRVFSTCTRRRLKQYFQKGSFTWCHLTSRDFMSSCDVSWRHMTSYDDTRRHVTSKSISKSVHIWLHYGQKTDEHACFQHS